MAEYRRELRARNREQGLCSCGRPRAEGRRQCDACLTDVRDLRAAARDDEAAIRERDERRRKAQEAREERARNAAHVGAAILAARVAAGLTQIEAVRQAGIPQSSYSRYERGAGLPPDEPLERIARAFGVRAGDLVEGPGATDVEAIRAEATARANDARGRRKKT